MKIRARQKSKWPTTDTVTIDWEVVFEDGEHGLLSLIEKSNSPRSLRKISFRIIKRLYTRRDDMQKINKLKREIAELITDDISETSLARVRDAIVDLLRDLKIFKIQNAAQYQNRSDSRNENELKISDEGAASVLKLERRSPVSQDEGIVAPTWCQRISWPWTISGLVAAGSAILFGYYIQTVRVVDEGNPASILAGQIMTAAENPQVKVHVFGGRLSSTTEFGRNGIAADSIPRSVCFDVAWQLVNKGIVIIDGKYSRKLSPTIIRKLCDDAREPLQLLWFPNE